MERAPQSVLMLAAALALGTLAVQRLPQLPSAGWCIGALSVALLLAGLLRWRRWRWPCWIALVLVAASWAMLRGDMAMQARLPRSLDGADITLVGQVSGLPRVEGRATGFVLRVDHASLGGTPLALHGKIRLAWYGAHKALSPCSRWHLVARLKRPRGAINAGGFDSERSALQRGIIAVGYVRAQHQPQRLHDHGICVDRLRARLSSAIHRVIADRHDADLLAALAVADKRHMDNADWQVLRATGTSHLFAISGLHIGLAAGLAALLMGMLWRAWPALALRVPRALAMIPPAWLAAFGYAALAGFGITTLRALLMISVVSLAALRRRALAGPQTLALAFVALLVVDPLAVLSAGFWLSFVGVAFLIFCLRLGHGWRAWLCELGMAQWVITVALLPMTVWFFGQNSMLAPLANVFAVPIVGVLVVPLTLTGTALLGVSPALASLVLQAAAWVLHATWWCLQGLAALPFARMYWSQPSLTAFVLAMIGAVWLLLPRGVPARWLGLVLWLPLALPPAHRPQVGGFRATVVDVGQGLAVVVRTRHHALVYDAGPRYPSGFDLGRAAVVPTLHADGVSRLNILLISHGDNDHAGGGPAVAAAFPHVYEMGSEPKRSHMPLVLCHAGQHWRWDGVDFRMVFPGPGWNEKGNNGSCVLLINGHGGRLLLTGDIEALVEPAVVKAVGKGSPLVLVVPHHGSDSSSTPGFIAALHPLLALNSAGYHNRFGHPRAVVLARYRAAGVPFYNTASGGALTVSFAPDAAPHLTRRARLAVRRYWRE